MLQRLDKTGYRLVLPCGTIESYYTFHTLPCLRTVSKLWLKKLVCPCLFWLNNPVAYCSWHKERVSQREIFYYYYYLCNGVVTQDYRLLMKLLNISLSSSRSSKSKGKFFYALPFNIDIQYYVKDFPTLCWDQYSLVLQYEILEKLVMFLCH